jgi:uncharacterized protein
VLRVGLISDTHGVLRPEAVEFLRGSDHIVHAGDVGDAEILDVLSSLAPLTAVRGNNDRGRWAARLPEVQRLSIGPARVFVIHDLGAMDIDPPDEGVDVVVYGHSHRPQVQRRDAVLYVNPGSAGPRRFGLPVAAAELVVAEGAVSARIREFRGRNAARLRDGGVAR